MSDPTTRNRLSEEASPYLRQHADNPVHWQPWDDAALAAARERDVPIFLSVGYSACHWCHVMEAESFEDERVAERLNDGFVPIKVDREERPDLDSIYQTICQLVTGHGGWPLSVWLTPDGRPFYVGTYFPTTARGGRPGFLDVLENLARSWKVDRDEVENRADQWTAAITDQLEETTAGAGERPGTGLLTDAASAALRAADRRHGGFGQDGPKFPQTPRIELLARAYDRTGRNTYLDVVTEVLDAMADRGLYDHLGGGFHRYATDREWIVPHFEKMLYDNAAIPSAFLTGYRLTSEDRYARVVRETFDFVSRELTHPDGGFYSTLDAQSEGEEGTFYVWTPAEVREAIGDDERADLCCARYGVTEAGNFEGSNVLTLSRSIEDLAADSDRSADEVRSELEAARERLFEAREERVRPRRDEKVLAGWNGLMIAAMADGGFLLGDSYVEAATDALEFCREHLWDADRERLSRRFEDGSVGIDGYLEDYAFLARGAFDLYQVTGRLEHLAFSLALARAMIEECWDADAGTLYFTPETGERLVARPQELVDQSTPSSLGVALDVLCSLSPFAPDDGFESVVETVLSTHGDRIRSSPLQYASLAMAADRFETGSLEWTVVVDELPSAWRERLAKTYLPGRILGRRPPGDDELSTWLDALDLASVPPIWAARTQRDGRPTSYVCRSNTCSPPLTDLDEALEWVEDLAPGA